MTEAVKVRRAFPPQDPVSQSVANAAEQVLRTIEAHSPAKPKFNLNEQLLGGVSGDPSRISSRGRSRVRRLIG